jgi:dimethylamine/trimethylamine dehydrogenase
MITSRIPNDELYYELKGKIKDSNKFNSVTRIGDCLAPATIASAVYDGRKYAMEFDDDLSESYLNKRDSNF